MSRRTLVQSVVLVAVIFAVLLAVGTLITSGPSEATEEAGRIPTTTTTTEPPPEGVVIVRLDNGAFRPANLSLDLAVTQTVRWINEDTREYVIVGTGGTFESPPLAQGDTFEFDFSTLDPGIYRYNAVVGFQRIPGSVDTRPEQ
jgi:plastocyanin